MPEVEDQEAHEIAAQRVVDLHTESYEHLVASYLDRTVHDEIVGATGTTYDVEVHAFWENPRQQGTLVVQVAVDWPQRGLRSPAIGDLLVGADGNIVSEREPQWFRELDNVRRPVWYVLYLAVTAILAWVFWGHGNPGATGSLFGGLWMAALFAISLGVRRWWVRRRRKASTKTIPAGDPRVREQPSSCHLSGSTCRYSEITGLSPQAIQRRRHVRHKATCVRSNTGPPVTS